MRKSMTNNSPVLGVEGYTKQFSLHEQGVVIPSSQDVNLQVDAGSLTALIGPTGSGKSSVLKGIYRTYLPTAGRLRYTTVAGEEVDLAQADEYRILELRRNEIGFVTQFLHFLPRQPSDLVVAQPLVQRGRPVKEARALAHETLAALNLPERLWGVSPATFSGGEKQRVNLARGLVARPRLLLLDEPTASLDPATSERVVRLIEELKHEGVAILAIFHQPELVERLADRVVELQPPNQYAMLEDIA
jgi:alpha-D-ribose 1-methylphosphonate 5-triphosphate synthase subunit PhnL